MPTPVTLERIERHFGEAIVKLVPSFWGKPVIAAILRSYVNRVQEFEDDCFEVMNAFDIRTCDATRLAILGKVVGQPNLGWDTETYRAVVRAKIASNRSHGRENDLVNVLRLILGSPEGMTVSVQHYAPATVTVSPSVHVDAVHMPAVQYLMPKARAAGVKMHFLNPPAGGALTWASSVSGGGGDLASSVSGGGDDSFSTSKL
jgi:hypothetical protein